MQVFLRTMREEAVSAAAYPNFAAKPVRGLIKVLQRSWLRSICGYSNLSVEQFNVSVEQFSVSVEQFSVSVEQFNVSVGQFSVSVGQFSVSVGQFSVSVEQFNVSVGQFNLSCGQFKVLVRAVQGVVWAVQGLVQAVQGLMRAVHRLVRTVDGLVRAVYRLVRAVDGLVQPLHRLIRSLKIKRTEACSLQRTADECRRSQGGANLFAQALEEGFFVAPLHDWKDRSFAAVAAWANESKTAFHSLAQHRRQFAPPCAHRSFVRLIVRDGIRRVTAIVPCAVAGTATSW